jgi:uncharacterized membrane protein
MKKFMLFMIVITFLFLFLCFSLQGQTSKEVEKLVDRAVELIKDKNYTGALHILEEAKIKIKITGLSIFIQVWPIILILTTVKP